MSAENSSRTLSDRSVVVAIVAVGVSLCTVILATDDGDKIEALDAKLDARIDALDAKLDARIDALETKFDARIDALDARIDALDAKVDDIRVYIAAKHGERVSFTPEKTWQRTRLGCQDGRCEDGRASPDRHS